MSELNLTAGKTPAGVQTIGSYIYVMLLDTGVRPEHLVMRVKSDTSEIKFYKVT